MESLVRYVAVALAPRGITVNSVSPGLTDDSVFNWTPMGRMGTPADIGNVVALLCSPDSAWITGQLIYADGGASLVDTLMPLEIQRS
jgi:NAD(P)-dependent dehydrogenase (short-subunit alcohol dehydrogenase family)